MRIGLDIDGVLYQWSKTARYMLRNLYQGPLYKLPPAERGWDLTRESIEWNSIPDAVTEEAWDWLWTEGVRLGLFRYGHLYTGAIEAVRALSEIGDVVAITHRPKNAVQDTLAWLDYTQLPWAGVHLLTNQEPKSSVSPQCQTYIDDKPENVWDLSMNTDARMVALMNRPWNLTAEMLPATMRAYSMSDYVTLVRRMNGRH